MALKYRIIYSPSAIYDLDEIYEYIAGEFFSPDTAQRQITRILRAAETLAVFPKMYRVRRKNTTGCAFSLSIITSLFTALMNL